MKLMMKLKKIQKKYKAVLQEAKNLKILRMKKNKLE
jgi:hypothetical protein